MDTEGTGRIRLLHVDDHSTVIRPLSSRLEAVGDYHVTVERDVDAAIDSLQTVAYDCVLLADTVASTSAAEFCRRVRAAGFDAPILVLTFDPETVVSDGILDAGATDVVDTSSDAFLRLLRQRIRLVVDSDGSDDTAPSITRLLADLPLGVFVQDETISYANGAFLELLDVDDEPGTVSIGDLLATADGAALADSADPQLVRPAADATESGTLALWTGAAGLQEDGPTVGALWDLDAGTATLAEFERHHAMLASLLESLPVAASFRDAYGRYVAVSDQLTELGPGASLTTPAGTVHHTRADVRGKTDYDLFPTELAAARRTEHEQVTETERPVRDGGATVSIGGEEISLATVVAPWYDRDGNVVGSVEVTRDVSERVRSEHEAKLQRAIVDVVGDALATELGTAVAQLDGSAAPQLPDLNGDDHGAADPVTHVRSIAADLSAIVDAARTAHADPEPTQLDAAAREAWQSVPAEDRTGDENRPAAGPGALSDADVLDATGTDCTLEIETEAVVLAEPKTLERLLTVLFENAVEHGAQTVRVGALDLGFFVADDGGGIPLEERERVFQYGYSTTPDAVGSGLALARLVATAHEWELSIADSAAGGTRVEVDGVRFR